MDGPARMINGFWAIGLGVILGWVCFEVLEILEQRDYQLRLVQVFRPHLVKKSKAGFFFGDHQRRLAYLKQFPDFLDLLALGISSGSTLEQAWSSALEVLTTGPLKSVLVLFEHNLHWGRSRAEAFGQVSSRIDDSDLRMTLTLIEQAMEHGVQLKQVLIDQAEALRQRRWSQLERRVQTAGLRLLFPIFVFILPAVFIILFAPLAIKFSQGLTLF